ncbi:MAG: polysaccharide deacetylase family protein [Hespellia sp.]|nr:polysaccharide deacetylase family protein [Hespellia sp.]
MKREQVHRHRNKKKKYTKAIVIGVILAVLLAIGGVGVAAYAYVTQPAIVQMKAEVVSMLQDETVPEFKVDVICNKNPNTVLDFKERYTVSNLVKDLKAGKGYTVSSEADTAAEGEYPIIIKLGKELEESIEKAWFGRVDVQTENAVLTVKNKYGEWDGSRFKRWDGTYVSDDFVVSQGSTYYFDSEGNSAVGWQDIRDASYYFGSDGKMAVGWLEPGDGGKYYFQENGQRQTGWLETDGAKYYLGEDGRAVTGDVTIDDKICTFAEDGTFQSERDIPASNVDRGKPMIALTFDDGPGPRTMELLGVLEANNARATFFMLGQKVGNYGDTIQKMKEIGCEIGNHSWDHTSLDSLSAGGVADQINSTNDALSSVIGVGATVMRPPYGAINETVKENVGLPLILWSVDTLDWKTKSKDATVTSVMTTAGDGDIVLMHDIHSWSVDAAIECIPKLIANGYQLVTVSEMAEAKGTALSNGGKYCDFY